MWADCFLFVYSITDRNSFEEIINLKKQVENVRRSTNISGILVGNKLDLLHDRQVPVSDASELADEIGCKFYEVSAADWTQVADIDVMFQDLFREYRRAKMAREGRQRKTSSSVKFKQAIQKVISGKAPVKKTLSAWPIIIIYWYIFRFIFYNMYICTYKIIYASRWQVFIYFVLLENVYKYFVRNGNNTNYCQHTLHLYIMKKRNVSTLMIFILMLNA